MYNVYYIRSREPPTHLNRRGGRDLMVVGFTTIYAISA